MSATSKSKQLDQFYTNPVIAQHCICVLNQYVNINDYDMVLEPSAGNGAFFDILPPHNRIGIDIDPQILNISTIDFFEFAKHQWPKTIVIGNPPFGVQSSLATRFFNTSANNNVDTIAFIVPVIWEKWSIHKRLNQQFKLIHTERLPTNSFIFETQPYNVRCVFQIWTTLNIGNNIRITTPPITSHPDFVFLPKSKLHEADFLLVVCGSRKQLIHPINSPIAQQTVERIKCNTQHTYKIFNNIDWCQFADSNTGTMWINRETIVNEYTKALTLFNNAL